MGAIPPCDAPLGVRDCTGVDVDDRERVDDTETALVCVGETVAALECVAVIVAVLDGEAERDCAGVAVVDRVLVAVGDAGTHAPHVSPGNPGAPGTAAAAT